MRAGGPARCPDGAIDLGKQYWGGDSVPTSSPSAEQQSIFGSIIVLMLFFNVFAQLILFITTWIAHQHPGGHPDAGGEGPVQPDPGHGTGCRREWVERTGDGAATIAARSVQVGLGAGYVTGAATGVGLGPWAGGWCPRRARPQLGAAGLNDGIGLPAGRLADAAQHGPNSP